MKKWFLLLAFCFYSFTFATPIQDHAIDTPALLELAAALDIPQNADLLLETQKHWLRKAGLERWEVAELCLKQRLFVLEWAEKQKLFTSWTPALATYDKALILGATTSRMKLRLDYLKQLWLQGIRFHEIVYLTGDRPLDSRVDDLTDRCHNESEAARILWQEADLPEEMRALPVTFVAVPMKQEGSSLKRPNTEDTIIAWLNTSAKPCSALFVSNQPFCIYQYAVIKACLPAAFQFDLVGPGEDPTNHPTAAATTLDSIARWMYTEVNSKFGVLVNPSLQFFAH